MPHAAFGTFLLVPAASGTLAYFDDFNFRECRLAFHVFAHELLIVEVEPYIWCPGSAKFSAIQAAAGKYIATRKKLMKKHLSPSRRRALPRFFVQSTE